MTVTRRSLPITPLLIAAAALGVAAAFLTGLLDPSPWRTFLSPTAWRFLGEGLLTTLLMGGSALALSLAIAVPLGMARAALTGPLRFLISLPVELARATPILAILFIVFFGFPKFGVRLPALQATIIGLTIYNSAVIAEIVRAGIGSIPRGEVEAARSLGLSYGQTMRHVVLPQALARMTPAIVSQVITLIKDTSLAYVISGQELVRHGRQLFTITGDVLETYFVVACVFFVMCYSLSRLSRRLEARQPVDQRVAVSGEEDQLQAKPLTATH